jgi:hypothetical protein
LVNEIIGGYLASSRVDGLIPWSELEPIGVDEPETKLEPLLRVRRTESPGNAPE